MSQTTSIEDASWADADCTRSREKYKVGFKSMSSEDARRESSHTAICIMLCSSCSPIRPRAFSSIYLSSYPPRRHLRIKRKGKDEDSPFPIPPSFKAWKAERAARVSAKRQLLTRRTKPGRVDLGTAVSLPLQEQPLNSSSVTRQPTSRRLSDQYAVPSPRAAKVKSPTISKLNSKVEREVLSRVSRELGLPTDKFLNDLPDEKRKDFDPFIDAHLHHFKPDGKTFALFWAALAGLLPRDDVNPGNISTPRGAINYRLYLDMDHDETYLSTNAMPIHHALVQLQFPITPFSLLPDGTDHRFLPGPGHLWKYRLWASGSLSLFKRFPAPLVNPQTYHIIERPVGLRVTDAGRSPKAFVTIRRSFRQIDGMIPSDRYYPDNVLQILGHRPTWDASGIQRGGPHLEEEYTLCFLQEPPSFSRTPTRIITPPTKPQFTFELVPTRHLLFCWSAITYNAHLIHLDTTYAQKEYGAPNLLVHGPLTVFLAIEWAQRMINNYALWLGLNKYHISAVTYKCLQPLYVDEPMMLCMKPIQRPEPGTLAEGWDVWIEKKAENGSRTLAFKAEIKLKLQQVPSDAAKRRWKALLKVARKREPYAQAVQLQDHPSKVQTEPDDGDQFKSPYFS